MGRKRSLRARRQPVAEPEAPSGTPVGHARVVSPSDLSQTSRDRIKNKPRPVETSYERSVFPQIAVQDPGTGFHSSPGGPQPSEMMIGVALGSPGQSPLPPLPPDDSTSLTDNNLELQDHTVSQTRNQEVLYSKASRWKTFGSFFGKKSGLSQVPAASPFHQMGHRPDPIRAHDIGGRYQSPPSSAQSGLTISSIAHTPSGPSRDWIGPGQLSPSLERERKTLRNKPSLRRNHFARKQAKNVRDPGPPETNHPRGHQEGSPKLPPKDGHTENNVRRVGGKGSLLQVDIPNVELERYSVMFSSLLQPCQQSSSSRQPSPKRQPSLLARRQANLQELHTGPVPTFERPWMHRELSSSSRAASPNRSPSFSLFPPSPTACGRKYPNTTRGRSPLHRSATTPGAVSPNKVKFDFSIGNDQTDQVVVIVHTPTEPSKPRQPSRNESFLSDAQSFTTARGSPAADARSGPSPRNNSPRRPSPARTPSEDPLYEAAEISIARQISVSERQRQLLVQAVPKVAPQPVQPQIVDALQGHRSRKSHHSHHLVFEDAQKD
ncbi:MAG: hypothetical protein Q9166_004406 [cf. Caloplaca sp. 2 TL-2023]